MARRRGGGGAGSGGEESVREAGRGGHCRAERETRSGGEQMDFVFLLLFPELVVPVMRVSPPEA
jgi:hypothetical protein